MIKIIGTLVFCLMMQACVANPTPPATSDQKAKPSSSRFSISAIKKQQEAEYASKLIELNAKTPAEDVEQARKNNRAYLFGYYAGRGGAMKAPGLSESQLTNNTCEIILLDGMGDSIYGENHMRFRAAQRQYALEFNTLMLTYCR